MGITKFSIDSLKRDEKENISILIVTHDAMVSSNSEKVLYIKDSKINKIIEKNNKERKEFFQEILEVVLEEAEL